MRLKYVGPHDAVDLVGHDAVERGKTVEVTGSEAASLAKQADWERVDKPRSTSKPAAKTAASTATPAPGTEKKE